MTFNLENRPQLEEGECAFKVSDYCKSYVDKWFEGFKNKFTEILNDPEKWVEENVFEGWTVEGLIQKFIRKEILGE